MTVDPGHSAAPANRKPPDQPPCFIVTSGRSGSTMLARMLNRHPDLVCISDLFEPVGALPLINDSDPVSTDEFLATLCAPSLPERIRYWRSQPTDELLHMPENDRDVSLLMTYTLPFLQPGDPDGLLKNLVAAMGERAPATMAEHLQATFAWLRDQFGGTRWVERTGGSLPHAQDMVRAYPDGRFVHLHRDPAEVAISMQTGSFFRLYRLLEADPTLETWDWTIVPSAADLGRMLDRWELEARDAWAMVEPSQFLPVSYEDLMSDSVESLLRLVGFLLERPLDNQDRAWAETQAGLVTAAPLRRFALDNCERLELFAACEESRRVLGYA